MISSSYWLNFSPYHLLFILAGWTTLCETATLLVVTPMSRKVSWIREYYMIIIMIYIQYIKTYSFLKS